MKKWILSLVMMCAFLAVLAGCGSSEDSSGDGEENKTLRVLTNAAYAPMEYMDKDNVVGFDIDFIKAVAEEAGYELDIQHIDDSLLLDTFYILCTYLGCIFVTMLLVKWTGDKKQQQDDADGTSDYEYLNLLARETAEQDAAIAEAITKQIPVTQEIVIDYTPYCDEKSELLLELRAKNKSTYAQALLVGKLASEIAKSIGLNDMLTKAAGLYKKIGKIKENNDENTTVEIAKEHDFPETLISLLDQLNHNRIEQKEAALLLITDGVISYYTIVRHVQKTDISVEKIVDTIVSKKIFQGEFNESDLSMQECFLLREKLIDLLKSQDKKRAAN